MLGNTPRRLSVTKEEFQELISLFELHRDYVERKLFDFDEENQSWKMYAAYEFENIPDDLYSLGRELIRVIKNRSKQP